MKWILSLPDEAIVAGIVLALVLVSLLLRQLEVLLVDRGYVRVAAALAALRGLIVDAPAVAARVLAAVRAREPVAGDTPAPPPGPRTPPPGLTGIMLMLTLALAGCAGPLDGAKRAANAAHDLAPALGAVLDEACTAEYQRAPSPARVAELDRLCLPLRASYRALRAAHLTAVAVIVSVEAGRASVADAISAGAALLQAIDAAQAAARGLQ